MIQKLFVANWAIALAVMVTGCGLADDGGRAARQGGRVVVNQGDNADNFIPAAKAEIDTTLSSANPVTAGAACTGWSQGSAQGDLEPDVSWQDRVAKSMEVAVNDLAASGQNTVANVLKTKAIIKAIADYENTTLGNVNYAITQTCNVK